MHEMKGFVDKIITELKTNARLKSDPLVKMLTESIDKSISLGENEASIYNNLKSGITSINAKIKNKNLEVILEQFKRAEVTPESQVSNIAKKVNLSGKIAVINKSQAVSNPIIKTNLDLFESYLTSGTPDFALCESFIATFSQHMYDSTIKAQVNKVKKYLNENKSTILFLNTIYSMDSMPNQNYANVSADLKNLLINESYTSDILKLKYGTSVPLVNQLISDLRVLESQKMGYFTLGEGDSFTKVTNLITPATKAKDGLIVYMDDRFVSIRESKGLTGKETRVFVDGKFKIAEIDPNYVKEKFPRFYSVAESFATLGFKKNVDGTGVDSNSIRNFNISFKSNDEKELDLYLNESKVEGLESINIMEALALEDASVKHRVVNLFENTKNLFNFDFIKELSNDRTLSEATILKLNDEYYVCEKLNAVERDWKKVDEYELYEFCMTRFQYDISNIFQSKIEETVESYKKIEAKKNEINVDISKLSTVMEKLQAAISNPDLDSDAIKKLEGIRESVESAITALKHDYVGLDLFKRDITNIGRNYSMNESTSPDYSSITGKTVTFTPVGIVEMTDMTTGDFYDFESMDKETMGDKDRSFIESLKNNPLIGKIVPNAGQPSSNKHMIKVELEKNPLGQPSHIFQYECGTDVFSTRYIIKPILSQTFQNKNIKVEYRCDSLKAVLDGLYPCATDFAQADTQSTSGGFG
jgi:hypothetical protein